MILLEKQIRQELFFLFLFLFFLACSTNVRASNTQAESTVLRSKSKIFLH